MASVGEVTATLDLDLGPFNAKLASARTALAGLGGGSTSGATGGAAATSAVASLSTASLGAKRALESMGASGVKSVGDVAVQMKMAKDAFSGLTSQVAKAGGFMGLDPQVANQVRSQMSKLDAEMQSLSTSTAKSESSFATMFRTLTKASFVFVGIIGLKAAIDGIGQAISGVISESVRFEQVTVGFEKLYGGVQQAKTALAELAAFASRSPFEIVDTERQALRLRAYGFAASEVIPILRNVGDAASGLGTGTEGINRITLALGQMRSAGRMNSRDMLQLTEAFVPAWDYVATAIGKTTGEVRKMSEKGLIPAELAIAAIRKGMQRDFGGMMAAQMKTLGGQWSNFKDQLTLAGRRIGDSVLPGLKDLLSTAAAGMPRLIDSVVATVSGTNEFGRSMRVVGQVAVVALKSVGMLFTEIGKGLSFALSLMTGNWADAWAQMKRNPLEAATAVGLLGLAYYNLAAAIGTAAVASKGFFGTQVLTALPTFIAGMGVLGATFKTLVAGSAVGEVAALGGAFSTATVVVTTFGAAIAGVAGFGIGSLLTRIPILKKALNDLGTGINDKFGKSQAKYDEEAAARYLVSPAERKAMMAGGAGTDLDKMIAEQKKLMASAGDTVPAVKGLSELKSAQLQAYQGAVDVAEKHRALKKAIKETGRTSAQTAIATLQLEAAQWQAKAAADAYTEAQAAASAAVARPNTAGIRAVTTAWLQAIGSANTYAAMMGAAARMGGTGAPSATVAPKIKMPKIKIPKVSLPSIGGGGGGGGGGADKAASAAKKIADAIKDAVKGAKELGDRFRDAVREMGNFAGLFDKPERAKRRGSFMGAANSQLNKLKRYDAALKKLQRTLPEAIFDEVVASGASSMDDVIRLANSGMGKQWAKVIAARNKVAQSITRMTMHEDIAAGRADLVRAGVKAAGRSVRIDINMNGQMHFHGSSSAKKLARELAREIEKELRAMGVLA